MAQRDKKLAMRGKLHKIGELEQPLGVPLILIHHMQASDSPVNEVDKSPNREAAVKHSPASSSSALLIQLRDWLWEKIQEQTSGLLEELSPWLRWIVWDALLTILLRFVSRRSPYSKAIFKFIGLIG